MTAIHRLLIVAWLLAWGGACTAQQRAVVIPVEGAIGAATGEFVVDGIAHANAQRAALIVLQIDTPGGLDSAMRQIIKAILASRVPVVAYVAPSGARAASAGTYILYASHIAAMAPATNLGAATPVRVGGGLPGLGRPPDPEEGDDKAEPGAPADAMERKLINDAVAYIRGLADLHGRNADWAERAVRESVSLQSSVALEQQVIDLIATDLDALLTRIDGYRLTIADSPVTLATGNLAIETLRPDWRVRLLSVITNPNVAYLLLMIGIYGLIFELANPGTIVSGVVGAVCLLLAMYALQLLPVNYAGLALIVLGVALMVGETLLPSFGALGLGGLAAFVAGSVILMNDQTAGISLPVILVAGGLGAGLSIWVVGRLLTLRRRSAVSGTEHLLGCIGEAREDFDHEGRIRVEGETWQALSSEPVRRGQRLEVIGIHGLTLEVQPVRGEET